MTTPTIIFRGGRLPAQPAKPHLKLTRVLHPELPPPPASADWLSPVPSGTWGMLGNDRVGDCTCAGVGHLRIGDVFVNQGAKLNVTTDETLAFYSAITGYDPAQTDPETGENPTDTGALCQDVLNYWRKNGFKGEKIVAFAKVDISDLEQVKQAIHEFGQIYIGLDVTDAAMRQTNEGETWDVVRGARDLGGHCVTGGAYDEEGMTVVTWGQLQKMTWAFFRRQGREAWVAFGPDDINPTTGKDRDGLDRQTMEHDFTALTGESVVA